jgi:hypothetical protein
VKRRRHFLLQSHLASLGIALIIAIGWVNEVIMNCQWGWGRVLLTYVMMSTKAFFFSFCNVLGLGFCL